MTKSNPIKHTMETTPPIQESKPLPIRLITHNIRYATTSPFPGEEPWSTRRPLLCSQLIFNSILPETFICLQEVLHEQLIDVLASLNSSGVSGAESEKKGEEEWAYVGVGRDDGKQAGEYAPIFYRPSIWKLENWKTKWLSETPDVPGKGWDASSVRIVTIGHFTHLLTGTKIVVMSTHLDNSGAVSRNESAKLILKEISSISTEKKDIKAVLLGGDFNSPPEDEAYQIMTSRDSSMEDVGRKEEEGRRYGNRLTFTSFGTVDNEASEIDFVFVRKGDAVQVRSFGVESNRFDDGVWLSDHRAVVADLVVGSRGGEVDGFGC